MNTIDQLKLKKKEIMGLNELKNEIVKKIHDVQIIIYGSKVRGDDSKFSDIDLLILIDSDINKNLQTEISWIKYRVELKYDIIIGMIIEKKDFWESALANAMPFHWNVDREGILI